MLDLGYELGYGSLMELIIVYVLSGLLFTYGVAIAIDISQSRRYDKRERELIQSILKGL